MGRRTRRLGLQDEYRAPILAGTDSATRRAAASSPTDDPGSAVGTRDDD